MPVIEDIIIADSSGTSKVPVWEGYVDLLEVGSSYSLTNFVVREYVGSKYLSMPREGAQFKMIDSIGSVQQQCDQDLANITSYQMHR